MISFKTNESRDHYHEDGNLLPNLRCGFCFEASDSFFSLESKKPKDKR